MRGLNNKVQEISIQHKAFKLKKPYVLSFGTLESFLSIQTKITLTSGASRIAEVVPLLGYNDESAEIITDNLQDWTRKLNGLTLEEARDFITPYISKYPFATSPILTAIDLFNYSIDDDLNHDLKYVVPTSTVEIPHFSKLLDNKSNKLKVKLIGHAQTDILGLKNLESKIISHPLKLRFDANQGYNFEDIKVLFQYLMDSGMYKNVEYIEQPLLVGQESNMGELRRLFSSIEIMFDESIVTQIDLVKAISNNINFIKLKLFKQGGINELISIAKEAYENKISVILGNGVATMMSNKIENEIFVQNELLFSEFLESNGFKKII